MHYPLLCGAPRARALHWAGGGRKRGCRCAGRSHGIALSFPINEAPPGSRARQTLKRQLGCSAPRSGGCSDRLPANHQQPRGGPRESQAVLNRSRPPLGAPGRARRAAGAFEQLLQACGRREAPVVAGAPTQLPPSPFAAPRLQERRPAAPRPSSRASRGGSGPPAPVQQRAAGAAAATKTLAPPRPRAPPAAPRMLHPAG